MTVSSQRNKVIYVGNGVAKEFAIPFSFLEQEHIKVRQKKNGIQTERRDWTIKNGNLIFADTPESGAEIAIVREVPLTQETDYRDNEILHAETLERCFDKLTMQVQQLEEKAGRAVTTDIFDATDAASLIPSIRQAVSDCTAAANAAKSGADTATEKANEAQTVLTSKADTDLSNLTAAGKRQISNLCTPSAHYATLTLGASDTIYTAQETGVVKVAKMATAAHQNISASKENDVIWDLDWSTTANENLFVSIPVVKGEKFKIGYTANGQTAYFRLYRLNGVN